MESTDTSEDEQEVYSERDRGSSYGAILKEIDNLYLFDVGSSRN